MAKTGFFYISNWSDLGLLKFTYGISMKVYFNFRVESNSGQILKKRGFNNQLYNVYNYSWNKKLR